jgi:signal recognition particle GTPase
MEIEADVVVDAGEPAVSNPTNPITDLRPEVDESAEPEVKEEKPEEPPIPKGVQKRIDRAVRQKYEAEARAKMLEERIAAIESRQVAPSRQAIDESEPTIDKFDNFDQYVAAKAEWIAERKINQTLTEREKRQAAEREATERAKTVDSWNKRIMQATAEMPDFEDVIASSDVPMTSAMQQAIMESDIGPKLAYYLANNQDEAVSIANMSPIGAIRALGRIEERLSSQKPAVKTTSAPPPIKPVGSRAAVKKDPNSMSDAEYAKWRKSGKS